MSEIIEWVLEMDVRDGQGDQVQPLLDDITKAALVDEPRTLHCEFYMSDDRRSCTVGFSRVVATVTAILVS